MTEHRKLRKLLFVLLLLFGVQTLSVTAWASADFQKREENFVYTNPDTGYQIYMADEAELLTEEEEAQLIGAMKGITEYGSTGFVSGYSEMGSAAVYADEVYNTLYGSGSGTIFLIDMDDRELRIESDGEAYRVISRDNADTITDNVYRMASKGDFYGCAKEAYLQMYRLLSGQKIARPMKWICNALLSLVLALLANYAFLWLNVKSMRASRKEILDARRTGFQFLLQQPPVFLFQSKVYDPPASSGGGGSGGGSRGGGSGGGSRGGGGGGSSGGGGGHRF